MVAIIRSQFATALITATLLVIPRIQCRGDEASDSKLSDRPEFSELVEQLASDSFAERQQAHEQLLKLKGRALAALEAARNHPETEVRVRVRRLIGPAMVAMQASLIDDCLKHPERLPAWKIFVSITGDSPNARKLFQTMQRSETALFVSMQHSTLIDKLNERAGDVMYTQRTPDQRKKLWPSISAILMVTAEPNNGTLSAAKAMVSYASSSDFHKVATSEPYKAPLQKLISYWLETRTDVDKYQRLNLANRYDLPVAMIPAMDMLKNGAPSPSHLRYAVLAVGRHGSKKNVADLERLFDNKSLLTSARTNGKETSRLELRDAALAAAIRLSGVDAKPFGFVSTKSTNDPRYPFPLNSGGFASDKIREAAFERWKELNSVECDSYYNFAD